MISVALLDDHPAVRVGLEAIFARELDLQLVGFAAAEPELWTLLERTHPAVIVLDLHHPGRDGLALCLQIKRRPDPPAVVLYSARTPTTLIVAGAVAGVDATVSKSSAVATLLRSIRQVTSGRLPAAPISSQMKAEAAARLDPADHAILAMRIAGESPVDIAATLGVPDARMADRIAAIVSVLDPARRAA
jgi:DNA-binding NarL/FixJ family response regulator